MKYNFITIEGCIGAGKTTLSERLAQELNAQLVLERFVDNPFLPKFYKDPEHYAFPLEMTFLTDRYQQLKTLLSKRDLFTDLVISDYFIGKCAIFSKNNLQADEYNLYINVYDILSSYLPKPEIIFYLHNSIEQLLKNIAKRGRDYERHITADYLQDIQSSYINYLKRLNQIPVVIVDTHELDFVNREHDYLYLKSLLERSYSNGVTTIIPTEDANY
ncbi:MAG: deoxynucleoside kinase [Bacteroidales bacterium]|nr:deoxynucleoside kinase [Bacteroidales bacterium]